MTNTLHRTLLAIALAAAAFAQPTVAPTNDPVGPTRGDNVDGYNIVNSFELGYRFFTPGGNLDTYRSTVNFGNGIRLLGSSLTITSREGHGHFFDELSLTTQGLGNDPYESAALRISKNGLYRYDLLWRENSYFNPGLRTDGQLGQHLLDTTYTTQDQDFTLFPQSKFKFFLGYSRSNQSGPALSTTQLFDNRGDEFPLFENVRRVTNEYRVGSEVAVWGIRLNWTRGWQDFKEDTPFSSGPQAGNNPNDNTTLTSFQRAEPTHGTSPYWRVGLFTDKRRFSVNGRFTYTAGRRGFVLNDSAFGTGRFGAAQSQQVITFGNADRPVATGNVTVSFYPTSKLTIVNGTSVYNTRIDGSSGYLFVNNATLLSVLQYFQFLGIRTAANETSVNYQFTPQIGFYAGYNYTNRLIRSIEQLTVSGTPGAVSVNQTNQLHSGTAGVRLRPLKPLTISLGAEVGRADAPLTPVADRNYHVIDGRAQYKVKNLTLSFQTRTNYNVNSVSLSTYASHARTYSANASWMPRDWFSVDAGYSKLHLNTVGGIAYFSTGQFLQGQQSYFFSNIHAANLGARFLMLKKRADLYLGYNHVQDTGDGRSNPLCNCKLVPTAAVLVSALPPNTVPAAFLAAQTMPLTYQSPLTRFSVRITERLRWNVGYQYYGYRQQFYPTQDFRAHTGYSSVLWSF